jgi:hypothetical protein
MDMFMPHGMCFLWQSNLILLHTLSDGFIGLSYFLIAIVIYLIGLQKTATLFPSPWITILFINFIFFCALTHFMSIVVIWFPWYWFEGILKLATGIISFTTALYLVFSITSRV